MHVLQNMKRGSLGTVQEQVQRAQRSLGAAHFTDIDAKFRTQQIELHTTELATSDLDKYHKVGSLCEGINESWRIIIN